MILFILDVFSLDSLQDGLLPFPLSDVQWLGHHVSVQRLEVPRTLALPCECRGRDRSLLLACGNVWLEAALAHFFRVLVDSLQLVQLLDQLSLLQLPLIDA